MKVGDTVYLTREVKLANPNRKADVFPVGTEVKLLEIGGNILLGEKQITIEFAEEFIRFGGDNGKKLVRRLITNEASVAPAGVLAARALLA